MEIKEEAVEKEAMPTSMFASTPEEEIVEETNELISSFLPPPSEEKGEEIIEESTTEKESEKMEKPSNESEKKPTLKSKKLAKQKIIDQKKTIRNNLVKVMDKVDRDIKDISKNLQIKNIIKLDAMTSEQASFDSYDKLRDIDIRKQLLIIELEALKNG